MAPLAVERSSGSRGASGPEVDAVLGRRELREREAGRRVVEAVAVRAGAEHQVEEPLGARRAPEPRAGLGLRHARAGRAGRADGRRRGSPRRRGRRRCATAAPFTRAASSSSTSHGCFAPAGFGSAGGDQLRVVAHREAVEGEVVVGPLERRRRSAGSRGRSAWSRSGRGRSRPRSRGPARAFASRAPFGVESTGLPASVTSARTRAVAGRVDLLGEAGDRAARRRTRAARARGSASARTARARRRAARSCAGRVRGRGNIAPPRAVEVAGQHVEHVDEPARERAELLRAGADAAVARRRAARRRTRARGGGSLAASMPDAPATRSGAKSRASACDLVDARACSGASRRGATSPSAKSTCTIAKSRRRRRRAG